MSDTEQLQIDMLQPAAVPHVLERRHPRTCSECDGRGVRQTEIWQEFWAQPPETVQQLFRSKADLWQWFRERGQLYKGNPNATYYSLPVSETNCPQCRGVGLYPPAQE